MSLLGTSSSCVVLGYAEYVFVARSVAGVKGPCPANWKEIFTGPCKLVVWSGKCYHYAGDSVSLKCIFIYLFHLQLACKAATVELVFLGVRK